ncbi:MAG: hypothetical protein R3268_10200, partial [Acidiferrobacterales bacterium]|nr:hypothetical protein [Acidiferrobacterales bacterium]
MSSFNDLEISREGSRPIELYEFTIGTESFRYTSSEDTITIGSNDFIPIAISRTRVRSTSESRRETLTVTLPGDNAFAAKYKNIVPDKKATLSIFRYQRDESPPFDTQ